MSSLPNMPGRGTDTIAVTEKDGFVILHFQKPTDWLALDAETARNMAEHLARSSYKVKFGDDPTTQSHSQITEQLRTRLTNRVAMLLRSEAEKSFEIRAKIIVDACLREVS